MSAMSDFLEGEIIKHIFRTGSFPKPTVLAIGLIDAPAWVPSTVYALNDHVVALTDTPAGAGKRLFKCTTAGTSGAPEPTWNLTEGGTTSDNTATWTEQSVAMDAGNYPEMPNSGAYARKTLNPLDANWTAPSGGNGTTDNALAIQFAVATADWGVLASGFFIADSATYGAGNTLYTGMFAIADRKDINNNDQFQFPVGNLDVIHK